MDLRESGIRYSRHHESHGPVSRQSQSELWQHFSDLFLFFYQTLFLPHCARKWPEEWNELLRNVAKIGSGSLFHCVCVWLGLSILILYTRPLN